MDMRTKLSKEAIHLMEERKKDAGVSSSSSPLSVEQEVKLINYHAVSIQHMCRSVDGLKRRSSRVQGTAIVYLKRFFLKRSILEHQYDPLKIAMVCLYCACKTEEAYISALELSKLVNGIKEKDLLGLETTLLKALGFDILVHLPYKAIDGHIMRITDLVKRDAEFRDAIQLDWESVEGAIQAKAYGAADALMLSDAPLLFLPGLLALAAVRSAFRAEHGSFDAYLLKVAESAAEQHQMEEGSTSSTGDIVETLTNIDKYGKEGAKKVAKKVVTEIDKQLKEWQELSKSRKTSKRKADRDDSELGRTAHKKKPDEPK
eukprot:evm.model.scf_592.4 EVM.evm.TU.scf_592.4   scf_592:21499-24169(+)